MDGRSCCSPNGGKSCDGVVVGVVPRHVTVDAGIPLPGTANAAARGAAARSFRPRLEQIVKAKLPVEGIADRTGAARAASYLPQIERQRGAGDRGIGRDG